MSKFKKIYRIFFPGIVEQLKKDLSGCQSVLDLGCGYNSPVQYANVPFKVGVDLFDPYLEQSKNKKIHNKYIKADINKVEFPPKSFDAVMAVDILEHLSKEDGLALLEKMGNWAKTKVILITPNGFLEQDSYDQNPLQEHRSGWTVEEFKKEGFKVLGMDGYKKLRGYKGGVRFKPVLFWLALSELSQEVAYYFPKLAFHLYVIKRIK